MSSQQFLEDQIRRRQAELNHFFMEIKNYYPLRVDKKFGSSIVSDTDPQRTSYADEHKAYEVETYGGHLIAESLPSKEFAQQLVDAYNEKYGPKDGDLQSAIESHERLIKHFNVNHGVVNFKIALIESVNRLIRVLFDYSKIDLNLKSGPEVDVAKVIEDLVHVVKSMMEPDGVWRNRQHREDSIQNAEAALGMLQAFKEKREPPEWVKGYAQVKTITRDQLVNDVADHMHPNFDDCHYDPSL